MADSAARTHRARATRGADRDGDRGSATVEFALALPAVVAVLGLAFSGAAWALGVEAAQRGAAEAARAAITEGDASAAEAGRAASGGSAVSVRHGDGYVTACVVVDRAPWPRVTRCATARERP